MMSTTAATPAEYVALLRGWRKKCVTALRFTVRASARFDEAIKWGNLVYVSNGPVLMKVPHPKVASGDDSKVTPDEKQALYDSYVAYFGTYSVNPDKGVVTHHVEADLADVYIGNDEERPYVLRGDTLILAPHWTVDGKEWHGIRVFERAN